MTAFAGLIRDVPDFPKPGILFKDIMPLLANADGYGAAVLAMAEPWRRRTEALWQPLRGC